MKRYEHELPLPPLEDVLEQLEAEELFYFLGSENRDGKRYRIVQLLGPAGWTVTGLHRIIAASALGHWVDRRYEVDHINHDPSDNRAENLEVVSPSVNRERRRQRLDASRAANPDKVRMRVSRRKAKRRNLQAETQAAIDHELALRNRYIDRTFRHTPTPSVRYTSAPTVRYASTPGLKPAVRTDVPSSELKKARQKIGEKSGGLEAKLRSVNSFEELDGILNRRDLAPHLREWSEDEIALIENRRRFLEKKRQYPY